MQREWLQRLRRMGLRRYDQLSLDLRRAWQWILFLWNRSLHACVLRVSWRCLWFAHLYRKNDKLRWSGSFRAFARRLSTITRITAELRIFFGLVWSHTQLPKLWLCYLEIPEWESGNNLLDWRCSWLVGCRWLSRERCEYSQFSFRIEWSSDGLFCLHNWTRDFNFSLIRFKENSTGFCKFNNSRKK